jgi:hypothetical protein
MTRRTFAPSAHAGGLLGQGTTRRNVVFCPDPHIGPVLGANGHPIIKTPNLDRLGAMGVNLALAGAVLASGMFPSFAERLYAKGAAR